MKKVCPNCGTEAESKFCPECGTELVEIKKNRVCPKCGTETESRFCPECGTKIDEEIESSDVTEENNPVVAENTVVEEPKKKNNKKIIIIIAAAVVLLALVCIIGSSSSDDESTSDGSGDYEYEEEETTSVYDSPSDFKTEACAEVSYDDLERSPDDYEGEYIKITGSVLQVIDGDTVGLRVDVTGNYDDVVYIEYDPDIMDVRVLEDDNVTLYGVSTGIYTYESSGAGSISIPSMVAYSIDIN